MAKSKTCPKCGRYMYYDKYFEIYICRVCGYSVYIEKVQQNAKINDEKEVDEK